MNFFKTFFKQLRNAVNFKLLYSVRSANETHSSIFTSFQQADVIVWALVSEFHLYVSCRFFFMSQVRQHLSFSIVSSGFKTQLELFALILQTETNKQKPLVPAPSILPFSVVGRCEGENHTTLCRNVLYAFT